MLQILKNIKIKNPKIKYRIPKEIVKIEEKIKEILAVTLSAQIMILPVMVIHFHTIEIYFWITNILVSIIIGPIVILGFITALVSFIYLPFSKIIIIPLQFGIWILNLVSYIGDLPFSKIYVATPKAFCIVIYYITIFSIHFVYQIFHSKHPTFTFIRIRNLIALFKFYFFQNKKKYICFLIIVVILSLTIFYLPKPLRIHFIDVGQGDSTFIITPKNKTILVDGGGSMSETFDVGKNILLPYILNKGYTSIDMMIISHFDSDHVLGLFTVMEEIRVKEIIIVKQFESCENYEKFMDIVKKKNIKVYVVEAGQRINVEENLYFNVLWPDSNNFISENAINNNSLVCKLIYKDFSMLFTGDIEEVAEKEIMKRYVSNLNVLKSTVLKVAHHGSKTSTSSRFLETVSPRIALMGVGENNNFGHPSEITIESLKRMKNKIYRTDEDGEITIITNGKKIKVEKIIK